MIIFINESFGIGNPLICVCCQLQNKVKIGYLLVRAESRSVAVHFGDAASQLLHHLVLAQFMPDKLISAAVSALI
jgi:hypothetical protein